MVGGAVSGRAGGKGTVKIRIFFIVLSLILVLLLVCRALILEAVLRWGVGQLTGLSVDIRKLHVGLLEPVLDVRGLRVNNPKDFPDANMLEVSEFVVRYVPRELIRGRFVFPEVRLVLEEFTVVKKEDGTTNISRLKGIGRPGSRPQVRRREEKKASSWEIGLLKLSIGRLVFKDYSVSPPQTTTYDIRLRKELRNIDDPRKLLRLLVVESLIRANIRQLTDVDLSSLRHSVSSLVASGTDLMKGTASTAVAVTKTAVASATQILKKTAGAVGGLLPSAAKQEAGSNLKR